MNPLGLWWKLWKRRNEPDGQRNVANALDTLGELMSLKTVVGGVQWVNLLTLLAQLFNNATDAFPALQTAKWVVIVQGLLGVLLPSVGGLGHRVVFGTAQDPAGK